MLRKNVQLKYVTSKLPLPRTRNALNVIKEDPLTWIWPSDLLYAQNAPECCKLFVHDLLLNLKAIFDRLKITEMFYQNFRVINLLLRKSLNDSVAMHMRCDESSETHEKYFVKSTNSKKLISRNFCSVEKMSPKRYFVKPTLYWFHSLNGTFTKFWPQKCDSKIALLRNFHTMLFMNWTCRLILKQFYDKCSN